MDLTTTPNFTNGGAAFRGPRYKASMAMSVEHLSVEKRQPNLFTGTIIHILLGEANGDKLVRQMISVETNKDSAVDKIFLLGYLLLVVKRTPSRIQPSPMKSSMFVVEVLLNNLRLLLCVDAQ